MKKQPIEQSSLEADAKSNDEQWRQRSFSMHNLGKSNSSGVLEKHSKRHSETHLKNEEEIGKRETMTTGSGSSVGKESISPNERHSATQPLDVLFRLSDKAEAVKGILKYS